MLLSGLRDLVVDVVVGPGVPTFEGVDGPGVP